MSMFELKRLGLIAAGLVILPIALQYGGLTYSTAIECVVLALAGLALNILLGYTGLVSFGHGAWFGIGAYAVGILQQRYFPESTLIPLAAAVLLVAVVALVIGMLILRRRGVYFSLLTLAFGALCFAVAYRWTALTGGENGFGGIERYAVMGFSMHEDDVTRLLAWEHTNICSDGSSLGHPRGYGTFPRVLGHYVDEVHALRREVTQSTRLVSASDELGAMSAHGHVFVLEAPAG